MDKKTIVILVCDHRNSTETDVEIPVNISANELIVAINESFHLGMDTDNLYKCYLSAENPIALLKGDKTIDEFGLHDGTVIHLI